MAAAAGADPYAALPSDLASAARAFDRAQLASDGAALKRLLAGDFRMHNSGGEVEDKAAFIADYTTHSFHLAPFTIEEPVMGAWPNGAVLGGLVTYAGTQDGKPFSARLRFADVWAKAARPLAGGVHRRHARTGQDLGADKRKKAADLPIRRLA